MLYRFPEQTMAKVIDDYKRPYANPIVVSENEEVVPDFERTRETDFMGWTWCCGPDGRKGWVPNAWIVKKPETWRMRFDFNAMELNVQKGEVVTLEFSESGFVFARKSDGVSGWVPDAVLQLVE